MLIKEINGIKIGFISYTSDKNLKSIPEDKSYLINDNDKEKDDYEIDM